MSRAPAFWNRDGLVPALLAPLGAIYAAATARRLAQPGWRAPVPVICVGNVSVGGTGKTPVALDVAARLIALGQHPHFLTRGYGGRAPGVICIDPQRHNAAAVGDEALLLAAIAPCWVGAARADAARAAVDAGATALIMDDGLQNPGLAKTLSFMVVDGQAGFGNGRVLPAGPLREPVGACAARVQAAVIIGPDVASAAAFLPPALPILRAKIVPGLEVMALRGQRVAAFGGIGRPEKFFDMLEQAGLALAARHPFPDHHMFTPADLRRLRASAAATGAMLVCTRKDHVRLAAADRADVLAVGMSLAWEQPDRLDALLAGAWA